MDELKEIENMMPVGYKYLAKEFLAWHKDKLAEAFNVYEGRK